MPPPRRQDRKSLRDRTRDNRPVVDEEEFLYDEEDMIRVGDGEDAVLGCFVQWLLIKLDSRAIRVSPVSRNETREGQELKMNFVRSCSCCPATG